MPLKNSDGVPIDPVPFLVVALLAGMILIGFGPLYLMEFGLALEVAVASSVVLTLVAFAVAYYRFVWTTNPLVREEVPAADRYLRLVYGILIGVLVLLGLRALLLL